MEYRAPLASRQNANEVSADQTHGSTTHVLTPLKLNVHTCVSYTHWQAAQYAFSATHSTIHISLVYCCMLLVAKILLLSPPVMEVFPLSDVDNRSDLPFNLLCLYLVCPGPTSPSVLARMSFDFKLGGGRGHLGACGLVRTVRQPYCGVRGHRAVETRTPESKGCDFAFFGSVLVVVTVGGPPNCVPPSCQQGVPPQVHRRVGRRKAVQPRSRGRYSPTSSGLSSHSRRLLREPQFHPLSLVGSPKNDRVFQLASGRRKEAKALHTPPGLPPG